MDLLEEGWEIELEDLAQVSSYLTEHIRRFGRYAFTCSPAPSQRPDWVTDGLGALL